MKPELEICVQGIESAVAAQRGGADRIELCADLAVGGVTPSAGMIAVACRSLSIPVHVLVRPRGGDFTYSALEFAVMRHDIENAKSLGASGVVLGVLDHHGMIDRERTRALIALARPMSVTFHKAFDACRDAHTALEALAALGVNRILTSGGPTRAIDGLERLCDLTRRAGDRPTIMAGGGVTETDIPALLAGGLRAIHVGSSATTDGVTDPAKVRRLVASMVVADERRPGPGRQHS
jgi:copper homeostasis protein